MHKKKKHSQRNLSTSQFKIPLCFCFVLFGIRLQLAVSLLQLFRERLSEKNVHATIPKGNMGYDQYNVPETVAVELSFVAFL